MYAPVAHIRLSGQIQSQIQWQLRDQVRDGHPDLTTGSGEAARLHDNTGDP
jgi:hypothetical protein